MISDNPLIKGVHYYNWLEPLKDVPPDSKLHQWSFLTHGNVMRLPIDDPYFQRYSEWPLKSDIVRTEEAE